MITLQNPKISVSNGSTTIVVSKVDLVCTIGTSLFAVNARCYDSTGKPVMVDPSLLSPMTADEKAAAASFHAVAGDSPQTTLEKACAEYVARVFGT